MDVYEAVTSRRAVRGFTDQPVPREVLARVLSAAAWSPSGSNLQPWHIYVLTGAPLVQLKHLAVHRVGAGDPWDEREFEMYPPALKSPYAERRSVFGKERYSALGIAREDWAARQRAAIANSGQEGVNLLERIHTFFFSYMEDRMLANHIEALKADHIIMSSRRPKIASRNL